jgi:hypothetical protein
MVSVAGFMKVLQEANCFAIKGNDKVKNDLSILVSNADICYFLITMHQHTNYFPTLAISL